MAELDAIANYAEIIGAILVVGGLAFAILELRRSREQRHREAAFQLFNGLETQAFRAGLNLLYEMPVGLTAEEIKARYADHLQEIHDVMGRFEGLSTMVYNHAVPIHLVYDFFQPSIRNAWTKLNNYVTYLRETSGRPLLYIDFEWLASRIADMGEPEDPSTVLASRRDWRPH